MTINKDNIYYIPNILVHPTTLSYVAGNVRPMCAYLTDSGLKRIVPNTEIYINGKPWYEVKSVSCRVTKKEYNYTSHCPYERETHWNYPESKNEIVDWKDKDWVYNLLIKEWLVPISYKNVFYTDSNVDKDGNEYVLTERFLSCETGFFHQSDADSICVYKGEMFGTWEECEHFIAYETTCAKYSVNLSDDEWSIREACVYLKNKGFYGERRKKYLDAFRNEDDLAKKELWVRDGKVYVETDCYYDMRMDNPKRPDNYTRSKKAREEYNALCQKVREYNWGIGKKLLIKEE